MVYDAIDGEENVGGYTVMKLYEYELDKEDSRTFKAYLRVDGDKVYFLNPDIDVERWFLMYDFGLKKGEGCYVYSGNFVPDGSTEPYKSYVVCTDIVEDEDYGLDVMTLEETDTPDMSGFVAHGTWIKGIGATTGVMYNNYFETQGFGSQLQSVKLGKKVVYEKERTAINDVSQGNVDVSVEGLNIVVQKIEKPISVALYTADGVCLSRMSVQSGYANVVVPKEGLYILRLGSVARKIVVAG